MLLAGDIGGTKTVLALYQNNSGATDPLREETYPSGRYKSLEQIIEEFLGSRPEAKGTAEASGGKQIERAVFGVAGPVVGGKSSLPNLPWVIDETTLRQAFAFDSVKLINDLEAIGYSVPALQSGDLVEIKPGTAVKRGNYAVIAPGTGLGETYASWDGNRHTVHPSEGGHADFAPVDEFQLGLLNHLLEQFDHVSYERVCSGTGIPNIYAFFRDRGIAQEPPWLAEELAQAPDTNAVIFSTACNEKRSCPICSLTVETFVSILAAEAGNMVLRHMTTGGLYLGGGIPPRILPFLEKANFLKWFTSKGRLSRLPEQVPVQVIMNAKAALVGAASCGLQQPASR